MKSTNKVIYSWAMYDWANSAFATTVMAAVLPNFFSRVAASGLAPNIASSYWGYSNTLSMVVIAVSAPVLGAIADYLGNKKKFLSFFMSLGVLFTTLLFFISSGSWLAALILYMVARIGFANANVFYDSLLPHITTEKNINQVSVLGYAAGYLGGGILLAFNLWMIQSPQTWGLPDAAWAARVSFITVAGWWALFSLPLFFNVGEPVTPARTGHAGVVRIGLARTVRTLKNIRRYREVFKFLVAFWFYNDGISTIIIMAVIFGTEIGLAKTHLIGAILLVQFIGIPFSILFGRLTRYIRTRTAIYLGLGVYTLISLGGYFIQTVTHFYMLAILVGCVQGGTQALSRSLFGRMVPGNKAAEFFGFFDVSQKFSGILGPFIFGLVAQLTGQSRWGAFSLVFFFISGIVILSFVDEKRGIEQKEAAVTI